MPASVSDNKAEDRNSREYLDHLRHSCTHVMAQAVQELFPGTKITIGPPVENGFYYDFDSEHHFAVEDLPKIEKRMKEIIKGNHDFNMEVVDPEKSRQYWSQRDEPYKVEILAGITETVSHCTHDTFTDLCRGGHVKNTRELRNFKLLSVAGAYWRGDEKNKMLQRIYGTAFPEKQQLKDYLKQLEEAKKRDHRKLGQDLELFSIVDKVGAGLVHWHPKGARLRRTIEGYLQDQLDRSGYEQVYTPHVASEELYKTSGHLDNYSDLMYGAMDIEGNPFRAKPMNCPNHIMIFKSRLHSYRELPIRYAEFGTVYRFERSGVLHGLMRVRGFTQDDAHIFCTPEQIGAEMKDLIALAKKVYGDFGFTDIKSYLSTRPEKSTGDEALWKNAEGKLEEALKINDIPFELDAGGGAFYGPKIDLKVRDAIGREWQMATIQLDFNLPQKFDVQFRDSEGGREHVVMIHRAILGSFERFIGVLIEHYAGRFPLWLAPVQVKILTLSEDQIAPAKEIAEALREAGLRSELDVRNEKIGYKIREATLQKIPYQIILGARDVEAGTYSLRLADGSQVQGLAKEELITKLSQEAASKSATSVFAV
jgi:threonyl-tRNA synthetase